MLCARSSLSELHFSCQLGTELKHEQDHLFDALPALLLAKTFRFAGHSCDISDLAFMLRVAHEPNIADACYPFILVLVRVPLLWKTLGLVLFGRCSLGVFLSSFHPSPMQCCSGIDHFQWGRKLSPPLSLISSP